MKAKNKKAIFIVQITDASLKVLIIDKSKKSFVGLEAQALPQGADDKTIVEKLNQIFKKLEYNNHPVVISLPRSLGALRYLKVPAQTPREIEKIASLQAPRYLPYAGEELITAYQVMSTDKDGYSDINLLIVHKDVIRRYLGIFQPLNIKNITIALSSFGLCNLYAYIKPKDKGINIIIDMDSQQVELVIASAKKLLFSRQFKLNRTQPDWQNLLIEEINKTKDAYLKEVSPEAPAKIIILGSQKNSPDLLEALNHKKILPVQILSYTEAVNFSEDLITAILNSDNSFASLAGLGLEDIDGSLNILPAQMKQAVKKVRQKKELLRLLLSMLGIILILGLGIAKDLDNKAQYLAHLKKEVVKIAKEARPLEDIERSLELLGSRLKKKPTSLDVFYELYQVLPQQVSLLNFSYEVGSQVILRGQTPELNSVFTFISELEKSAVFKVFNVKVRYATAKKTQVGEIVDFEIVCAKK